MGLWEDFLDAMAVSGGRGGVGGGLTPNDPVRDAAAKRLYERSSGQSPESASKELGVGIDAKAGNLVDAALNVTPRNLTDKQRTDLSKKVQSELSGGKSVDEIMFNMISALNNMPGAKTAEGETSAEGLPEGWSKTVVNGKTVLISPSGSAMTIGEDRQRTAAEEAASMASANASNASAEASRMQTALFQRKLDTLAKIAGGEIKAPPGFVYDSDGGLVDTTAANLNQGKQRALEAIRDGLIKAPEGYQYNPVTAALEDVGTYALQKRLGDLRAQEVTQSGQFQQGQLENERTRLGFEGERVGVEKERLGLDRSRLQLDEARVAGENLAAQQQNLLRMQDYRAKILSGAPDFIARSFMQSGQESPSAQITPADLLNQLASEYNALRPGEILTQPQGNQPGGVQMQPQGAPAGTPQLANGGTVRDRLMIVGDTQGPHQGAGNPEYVMNPTGAPIAVVPMNKMRGRMQPQGYANGTGVQQPEIDPETKSLQQKSQAIGRLLQHVDNPDTQHALVDELAGYKERLKAPTEPVPAYGEGTEGGPSYYIGGQKIAGTGVWGAGAPLPPGVTTSPTASATTTTGGGGGTPSYTAGSSVSTTLSPITGKAVTPELDEDGNPITLSIGSLRTQDPELFRLAAMSLDANNKSRMAKAVPSPELRTTTQAEIEAAAEANLSGRIRGLFGSSFGQRLQTANTTPNPRQPGGITPQRFQFPLFTPQQLSLLTPDELKALNSYLGVKYNTTLEDVYKAQELTFGTTPTPQRRGRLVMR